MICQTSLLFLAVSITSINASLLGAFAPRDFSVGRLALLVPRDLSARNVNTAGGWSLSQTEAATCPVDSPLCGATWCCPGALECYHTGSEDTAEVCCPTDADCSKTFLETPLCADASWSLWNSTTESAAEGGFFCCLPGQVGLQSGSCVEEAKAVTAGAPAVQLATGTGSAQSEPPATTTASSAAAVSATATAASTTGSDTFSATSVASETSTAAGSSSEMTSASVTSTKESSSSATSSSAPASSTTAAAAGKSGAAGSYHVGKTLIGGAVAAIFAFALL